MRREEPTTESLSISDVKSRLDLLVDDVSHHDARVVVERDGVPIAALVSVTDLDRLNRLDREREERRLLLGRLREPFRHVPPDQIEADVAAIVDDVRAEMATEREPVAAER